MIVLLVKESTMYVFDASFITLKEVYEYITNGFIVELVKDNTLRGLLNESR